MRPAFPLALTIASVLAPVGAEAQGTRADYDRADRLPALAARAVATGPGPAQWLDGGSRFWFREALGQGRRAFVLVDPSRAERGPAFDHAALAEALAKAVSTAVDPARLPFDRITLDPGGAVRFEALGKSWAFDPRTRALTPGAPLPVDPATDRPARRRRPRMPSSGQETPRGETSPDGRWRVVIKGHDLALRDLKAAEDYRLTDTGNAAAPYEPGVYWAPDSSSFVALQTARGDDRKVYLVEAAPTDQLQPRLQHYDYLKPGDRIPVTEPHLFRVATRTELPLDRSLTPYAWSVESFRWAPDSSRFTFLYNQRGHQTLRVVAVDAATGGSRALVEETSPTFVDYSQKTFLWFDPTSDDLIWMSERSGWNHLYRFDAKMGALRNPVTQGPWVVLGVDRVDPVARQVWFRAGGIWPGQDPYHVHHARVNFDGSGLTRLTAGDGTHEVAFSPNGDYLIATYSRVDLPQVTELRSARDGALVLKLGAADASDWLALGLRFPEPFVARGRDGRTDIYGVIRRPSRFDPWRKYPVIELIYAGPQGAFVPKAFSPWDRGQDLAELGFVVVQIDGMGTNWRSKAFHDVCWKNLGDAGLPDRVLWIKAAAAEAEPALDLTRVGVYGGSAGGQSALGALLTHGDFYKAAAADCGCHDNRMDKIWWNEAWMGWPVGPHYAEQSNVTNAHRLRGKLLLTVGALDHNVDPASTMQVVQALIAAGKRFDLVVFPALDHGAGESRYGRDLRRDFFVRNLLGVEPPDRNAAP